VISYKDIGLQTFSSQAVYNCYLHVLPNGVTEQSGRHASGMTSSLACTARKCCAADILFVCAQHAKHS